MHAAAVDRYKELLAGGARFLTSNFVIDETATRLRYGLGLAAALAFRKMFREAVLAGRLRIAWVEEKLEGEAWDILAQYADVKLSLTDATCAAIARANRVAEVLGCDSAFEALGFIVTPGQPIK